jgi:hypothetical protein
MEEVDRQLVPTSVILASGIIGIVAANHFVMRAMPALMALDPYGLLELAAVFICLGIAWGLLTLRRWAWMAGVALSGIGCLFPLLMMQDLEAFKLQTGFSGGTSVVIQFLLFLELAAFSVFILLMSDASKSVYQDHRPKPQQHDLPNDARATQTAGGTV